MQFWGSFRRFQVVLGGTYSSWSQLTHMSGTSVLQRWWNLQPQVWQRKPWNSSFRQKSQKASVKKVFLTCRGRQRQLEVVQGWYQEVLGGFGVVLGGPGVVLGGSRAPHTHKVVRCQRNILQNLHVELLSRQPRDVRVPANRLLLPEEKQEV